MSEYIYLDKENVDLEDPKEQFALDVLMGFSSKQKYLSSKYLYDDEGSRLFSAIMDTEEYYPTECEFEVLTKHKGEMAEILKGEPFNLVELGAGDGRKVSLLLEEFKNQGLKYNYLPVDISRAAIQELEKNIAKQVPDISFQGVVGEYMNAIKWITKNKDGKTVVLFLGSNIGNFNRPQALAFLRSLWNSLDKGALFFVGFDLKKDIDVMLHAYNDAQGVTAQFNLNVLKRINKELGANFDSTNFRHYGTYDPKEKAMVSYLVSLKEQSVYIEHLAKEFHFDAYEPVHMEYSYKYLESDIEGLARETGFEIINNFYDSKNYYIDSVWRVVKD